MNYKPVIGLEVHVELATATKMFCRCSAYHFGEKPNTHTCPVCLGLPGALPVANRKAIEDTIRFGLALGSKISLASKFDRKHYFYPDLPKAFQTSQYDMPLCMGGEWTLDDGKRIRITRVHLEEDTGKLVHKKLDGKTVSLIDFNRSGVPLMELVTEPDFDNTEDVIAFLKEIQTIVRFLGISDADMEKGSMRLEGNLSVSTKAKDGSFPLPDYKIELKNINSFRFLKKAMDIEIERHTALLEQGAAIAQETRGYDEIKDTTFSQRSKEEAKDYRYFPEPDIPPLSFEQAEIDALKKTIPEMPNAIRARLAKDYGLPENYCEFIAGDKALVSYFDKALVLDKENKIGPKTIAGAIVNLKLYEKYPEPGGLIKHLLLEVEKDFASADEVDVAVDTVINEQDSAVTQYKEGKTEVVGFLIGQVQKILKGTGDPKEIREKLVKKLEV